MRAWKVAFALTLAGSAVPAAALEWNTAESRARWAELSRAIFGAEARLHNADAQLAIDAPETAQDAALVPVTIRAAPATRAKELDLVIDQNPSPVAAKIRFGAAGDVRRIAFRVRVNAFTNMHAVAVTDGGKLLQTSTFVQGAGGCSAPMGMSEAEASAHMGEMRMKFATERDLGAPEATLMIRHPNFNGMQTDEKTHALTPARYIKSITVTRGQESVFEMSTDISLSTNPVIKFLYRPEPAKPFKVTVVDTSDATWTQQFEAPGQGHVSEMQH